jgi:peptidoglycan pentaglycine glycine transferase (the first glycine)
MENKTDNFIQSNSPDGGFLQSVCWRHFQESVGRKTFSLEEKDEDGEILAISNIIMHNLPIVGRYFYVPRGPVVCNMKHVTYNNEIKNFLNDIASLAGKNNIGWIRIEPNSDKELKLIRDNLPKNLKIKKSSVDMQPREILVIDISKNEEEILAQMKQKTRYNIKLAKKRDINVVCNTQHVTQKNIEEFLRLVEITAKRDKITPHPESYYRKMFEVIPSDILKLYIAEYEGKVIAANLVLFFGRAATYMHGASDDIHRDVMAPYLLQWRQILDAKKSGCTKYDFGGVKTIINDQRPTNNSWSGITKFKTGFAPDTKTIQFPGCYDIIVKPAKYKLYRAIQRAKKIF